MRANARRVHFGLGSATSVEKIEIKWPISANDPGPASEPSITVVQNKGIVKD